MGTNTLLKKWAGQDEEPVESASQGKRFRNRQHTLHESNLVQCAAPADGVKQMGGTVWGTAQIVVNDGGGLLTTRQITVSEVNNFPVQPPGAIAAAELLHENATGM